MRYKRLVLVVPVLHVYSFNFKESKWFYPGYVLHGMLLRKATSLLQPSSCTGSNRQGTSSFHSLWLQWSFLIVCWFMIYLWFMEAYFRFRIAFYLMLLRPSALSSVFERFHGIKTCNSHLWWEIGLWISKYRTQLPWSSRESSMIKRNDTWTSDILISNRGFRFRSWKRWDFGLAALDCDWREHWMAALGYWRGTLEKGSKEHFGERWPLKPGAVTQFMSSILYAVLWCSSKMFNNCLHSLWFSFPCFFNKQPSLSLCRLGDRQALLLMVYILLLIGLKPTAGYKGLGIHGTRRLFYTLGGHAKWLENLWSMIIHP